MLGQHAARDHLLIGVEHRERPRHRGADFGSTGVAAWARGEPRIRSRCRPSRPPAGRGSAAARARHATAAPRTARHATAAAAAVPPTMATRSRTRPRTTGAARSVERGEPAGEIIVDGLELGALIAVQRELAGVEQITDRRARGRRKRRVLVGRDRGRRLVVAARHAREARPDGKTDGQTDQPHVSVPRPGRSRARRPADCGSPSSPSAPRAPRHVRPSTARPLPTTSG